ncbi:MAG: hypothetical protein NT027_02130, partial [Proteobacteria bacterium]|nr:hypothetical protein [Pseudomonadota bacterium]
MNQPILKVTKSADKFVLDASGVTPVALDEGEWTAVSLDSGRLLAVSKKSGSDLQKMQGFAKCSIDLLHDMILGICHRRWSGMITVDTGFGMKKLFFSQGNLIFASSSLIDDRLGEIIYRSGMITLDQLTDTAVKVDRSTKFGQVLLKERIFTNTDLWTALQNQVLEIFRSIFIMSEIFIEVSAGTPPTEVSFSESTVKLVDSVYSAGKQFRSFFSRLRAESVVKLLSNSVAGDIKSGTFFSDVINLVTKNERLQDLLESSKLTDMNTLWVLHKMTCMGIFAFDGISEPKSEFSDTAFSRMKSHIDSYSILLDYAKAAFISSKIDFPAFEIRKFALALNEPQ